MAQSWRRDGFKRNRNWDHQMKRILDPTFHYRPSFATDLRKTFERVRRELLERARENMALRTDVRDSILPMKRKAT